MPILSNEDAETIKRFEEAALENGVVMDLLAAIEEWQSSGKVESHDLRFFELAAMAAPLARLARKAQGLDKGE